MANPIPAVDPKFNDLLQRMDGEFRHAVLQNLPKLAVQMDELKTQYSNKELLTQTDLAKPDDHLSALQAQTLAICEEATEQIHLIESRIRRLTSDVRLTSEVMVGDMLDRALKLTEALRRDLEDVLLILSNFHSHRSFHVRKMIKYPAQGPAALAEFDRKALSVRVQLSKARNVMVSIYEILSENLQHLMPEQSKKNCDGVGASSNFSFYY